MGHFRPVCITDEMRRSNGLQARTDTGTRGRSRMVTRTPEDRRVTHLSWQARAGGPAPRGWLLAGTRA
jgi:hypothetical protein